MSDSQTIHNLLNDNEDFQIDPPLEGDSLFKHQERVYSVTYNGALVLEQVNHPKRARRRLREFQQTPTQQLEDS